MPRKGLGDRFVGPRMADAHPSAGYCHRCRTQLRSAYLRDEDPYIRDGIHHLGPFCEACLAAVHAGAARAASRVRLHWSKYKLTLAEYLRLYVAQTGVCAICFDPSREGDRGLVVDHDHETGAVRALLCARCNSAIGLLGDDPGTVSSAMRYLEKHHARRVQEGPPAA